jgi:hypothetical protein
MQTTTWNMLDDHPPPARARPAVSVATVRGGVDTLPPPMRGYPARCTTMSRRMSIVRPRSTQVKPGFRLL